ncbi:MAG: DUF2905 domain-containing protein [Desulfurivibrionaceae bacterium]|nr:DUF2905 domain-containing protein [Desulfobulbales bacterium]MDT8334807.1 DUF2905 domain-containing protein [Desulfurivibrionaceae bacterium]
MRKTIIYFGLTILLAGIFWPWLAKLPIGRLPGDIVINRPGLKMFIPITTMLLVSVVVSIFFWIFRK